ncbi:hypothetical protein Tco_1381995, partial [Tanacetum coccineum]
SNCKARPRMVNPLNARNPTAARRACYECGGTDHYKSTCHRLNRAQDKEGIIQIRLWLLRELRVVGTMAIRHVGEHS